MRIALVAVLLVLGVAADAAAHIRVTVDGTSRRGQLDLYGIVSRDMPTATMYEVVKGRDKRIADVVPAPWYDDPEHGPLGFAIVRGGAQWRCDRLDRTFAIVGHYSDGTDGERSVFSVRTPSCRHRLSLKAPRRADPGEDVVATVRDTFGIGRISARICMAGACERARLRAGRKVEHVQFRVRARPGVRPLTLTAPGQKLRQSIAIGVKPTRAVASGPTVLTTGDSLMQSVDAILSDRLVRANVVSDVRVASGLSRATVVDFPKLARAQVREHKPAATAIFLGTNDTYPMVRPRDGVEVFCCDEPWIEEYARRAREMMKIYTQGGTAALAWLAVPAMRDERRNPSGFAVNAAIRRAARGVPGAYVVPVDKLLTPNGVYEPTVRRGGRQVTIREDDGIHLTIAGARIVVKALVKTLKAAGVV